MMGQEFEMTVAQGSFNLDDDWRLLRAVIYSVLRVLRVLLARVH
jgi:hypothetical protein